MEYNVKLTIDDTVIPLNAFVQAVSGNVVLGIIRSLTDVPEHPGRIELALEKKEPT